MHFDIGQERQLPVVTKNALLTDGTLTIDGGRMKEQGFLRCVVTTEAEGNTYRNLATMAAVLLF